MWIEHPGLGAEMSQDALGLQRQLAAVGLWPQGAVHQQDARRVRTAVRAQVIVPGSRKQIGGQVGEVLDQG